MATVESRGKQTRKHSRAKPKTSAAPTSSPSEDEIRVLAYCLYERRCQAGIDGDAAADWIQAERALLTGAPAARAESN